MAEATGLKHIADNQLDESTFNRFCNSFSVGPIKVDYCVDITKPEVSFEVYLLGVRIGGGTINPSHPCVTVGGSVAGFKAEATICVDPAKRQVTYEIEVCAPIVGCKKWKGVLFSW